MPSDYTVSATFNVSNLSSFDAGDDLRTSHLQEEGNDEIEDKTVTNTWDEAYSDPIQSQELKQINSKKCLMD